MEGEETVRESAPPLDCELQWVMLRECRVSEAAEDTLMKSAPPDELDEQLSRESDSKERRE